MKTESKKKVSPLAKMLIRPKGVKMQNGWTSVRIHTTFIIDDSLWIIKLFWSELMVKYESCKWTKICQLQSQFFSKDKLLENFCLIALSNPLKKFYIQLCC